MGEVWRATDTKLQRDVAIKILPAPFAADADRLARFAREAQVLASLNHPNIAHIYGVEEHALVMELVEGETLAQRIARGAVPRDEALPIAIQIADGLDYAHERGVVHRDLKPANIKITPEGQVKILDFGLAKAIAQGPDTSSTVAVTDAPTLTSPATMAGTILGTAAYMAPEQAKGKSVDRRADIWAYGAVLYELLTGKRAFAGEEVGDTLAAVLAGEPDLNRLGEPARSVVARCLKKDPRERWGWIGDASLALRDGPTAGNKVGRSGTRGRWGWMAAAAALAALALVFALLYFNRPTPMPAAIVRFEVPPPPGTSFTYATEADAPALSPDGSALLFRAQGPDGVARLWLRRLDSLGARPLAGTEGAYEPFWRPDGRYIGFAQGSSLNKMDLVGGPPVHLAAVVTMRGASWSSRGVILYAPDVRTPLLRISEDGGAPQPATTLDPTHNDVSDRWPWFLPDGRHFLYVSAPNIVGTLHAGALDTTLKKSFGEANSGAQYAAGQLFFLSGAHLMAQPFDAERLVTLDDPTPAANPVSSLPQVLAGHFAVAQNGTLAYLAGSVGTEQLAWFDRSGHTTPVPGSTGTNLSVELSPDGTSALISNATQGGNGADLWMWDFRRSAKTRMTFGGTANHGVWSPDGGQVAFAGPAGVFVQSVHDSQSRQVIKVGGAGGIRTVDDWSPDAKNLLVTTTTGIWVVPLDASSAPAAFKSQAATAAETENAQFSPDGHWVAYASDRSGRDEIYLTPFPGPGGEYQVSVAGGRMPRWSHDGKQVFYVAPDESLASVPVSLGGRTASIGRAVSLFGGIDFSASPDDYAVAGNGERFLARVAVAGPSPQTLMVVLNPPWAARR
jgi:eukaryotic-like serine/threonine-protein kinase